MKYYSVYEHETDKPIAIYRTAQECMKIMGVTRDTFYTYVTRFNKNYKNRKYDIYVDDQEDEDG